MCKVLSCCFAWLIEKKRYRYTGKERDDSSGLCYYGARYLTPWLSRWISPDSVGVADGLNLYVYGSLFGFVLGD
jgi:RHS repeat-associated protein